MTKITTKSEYARIGMIIDSIASLSLELAIDLVAKDNELIEKFNELPKAQRTIESLQKINKFATDKLYTKFGVNGAKATYKEIMENDEHRKVYQAMKKAFSRMKEELFGTGITEQVTDEDRALKILKKILESKVTQKKFQKELESLTKEIVKLKSN